jgi:hypothetical protein
MLKNLPPEGFALLTKLIQRFWNKSNCDFEHRYVNILSLLYKGKGKQKTQKLAPQFCHIGCQDALHTLKNIIMTRMQHGKESFVLFVDLVKAFDTITSFSLHLENMVFLITLLKSSTKRMQMSTRNSQ